MKQRLFDIAASLAGLVLASPLMAAIAVLVLVDSGRPILFRQTRTGRHLEPFTIFKFRSMAAPHHGGPLTSTGDRNVTRAGAFLRAAKLDELPQLWNVLRGDMSIVGPRPELPRFVAEFAEEFKFLLTVRPGLIDPASLAYYDESHLLTRHADPLAAYVGKILPRKLQLSAAYLRRRTFRSDVKLICRAIARSSRTVIS